MDGCTIRKCVDCLFSPVFEFVWVEEVALLLTSRCSFKNTNSLIHMALY